MESHRHVLPASQYVARLINWLWPMRLGGGKLTLLQGDPGLGKSLVALDLCARVSTGRPFPDGKPFPGGPGNALVINAEDSVEDTIRPRLAALGADLHRVFVWDRSADLLRLSTHMGELGRALADVQPRLVVLGPITAFLQGGGGSELSVRRALDPLARLAERRDCVMQMVLHLNKSGGTSALYRGCGSIAFPAASRFVWLAARDPQHPQRCVLAEVKNNYAPPQPALAYTVSNTSAAAPTLEWLGENPLGANELLAGGPASAPVPPRDRAREFLLDFLADGPQTSRAIWLAAQQQGLAERTLNRAKRELDVRSLRICESGAPISYWLLPGQEMPGPVEDSLEPWLEPLRKQFPPSTPLDDL